MIEREHTDAFNVSTLRIQQGRSANVSSHSMLLGGGLVRNNVHPVLAGEGGECLINGLFIGNGRQHLDNYMLVEHASRTASSRQFYNGILDGKSHGVFHGRIIVHKDAQKTDAKQTNRNLLLSDDAQIDTKPQLEIYADDVKCTHGATIGQIEENALFYLRSRGIDEALGAQAPAAGLRQRMPGPHEGRVGAQAHRRLDQQPSVRDGAMSSCAAEPGEWRGQGKKLGGSRMTAANSVSWEPRPCMSRTVGFDVEAVRRDFPILQKQVHGQPLVYLDNAATSQKPRAVIDAISHYYESGNANIHRGVHYLSEHATEEHEAARRTVQRFLNAPTSAKSSLCAAPPRPSTWSRRPTAARMSARAMKC